MVLKEWAEVWTLYKEGRKRAYKITRWMWVVFFLLCLSALVYLWGHMTGRYVASGIGLFLAALFFCCLWLLRDKALAKEFKTETIKYKKYKLASHPFGRMEEYILYVLFLGGLKEKTYSPDDIARLRRVAETMRKPEPAYKIAQHPVVVPLVTLFVGLLLDGLKQPESWKSDKAAVFIKIGQGIVGVIFLLWLYRTVTFTIPNSRHQEIERFLQWAEMDIKEQKSKDTVSG